MYDVVSGYAILLDRMMIFRTGAPWTVLYLAGMQLGELVEVAAAKNPCPHSSFVVAVVHNGQACIQGPVKVLLSDSGNRKKVHETSIWGPRIADRLDVVKVRGSSWVLIGGMANHHGKKKAMVIWTS
jgi:hypothetical protein